MPRVSGQTRASGERGFLIALGAITTAVTTTLLVIRPIQLPAWLPGGPPGTGTAVTGATAVPDPGPAFTVAAGDREITVSWPMGDALERYRALAVAETGDATNLPCRAVTPRAEGSTRCTVTGLQNGASYLVSVFATGDGDGSPALRTVRAIPRPALLTSADVVAWFDAGDYASFEPDQQGPSVIGSRVLTIRDRSRHHGDATQQDTKRQPTIGQLGKLPALALDGDDVLTTDDHTYPTGDTPSTVVLVAAQDDPSPDTTCFHNLLAWGTGTPMRARIVHKGCRTALAFAETWSTYADQRPTLPWPAGRPAVLSAVFEPRETAVRLDGAPSYRWAATAAQRMNTVASGIASLGGAAWDTRGGWQGRIGEVIVFDRALTATQLGTVEDYLGARWQVALSPS